MKQYLEEGPFEVDIAQRPGIDEVFTYILYGEKDPVTSKIPIYVGQVTSQSIYRRVDGNHSFAITHGDAFRFLAYYKSDLEEHFYWKYRDDPAFDLQSTHKSERTEKQHATSLKNLVKGQKRAREANVERIKMLKAIGFTASHPASDWWKAHIGAPYVGNSFGILWNREDTEPLVVDKPTKRHKCKACGQRYIGHEILPAQDESRLKSKIHVLRRRLYNLQKEQDYLLAQNKKLKRKLME